MATHESFVRTEVNQTSDKSFALLFGSIFSVIALLPLLKQHEPHWFVLALGLLFYVIAFAKPSIVAPLNHLWFKLGLLLSRIVSPVVMGLLFFVVLTPMAVLLRKKAGILKKFEFSRDEESLWIERTQPDSIKEYFHRQF